MEDKEIENLARQLLRIYYPIVNDNLSHTVSWESLLASEGFKFRRMAEIGYKLGYNKGFIDGRSAKTRELLLVNKELITVEEASKILRVRRETIRRYIKNGHLKAVTLPGGDYRLRERDIQKLLSHPDQKKSSQNAE